MKIAKADAKDLDALLNLMRVLNACDDDGFPCKPDGTWEEEEQGIHWFDPEDTDHLRKFYDRVMGCIAETPGALTRAVSGFHLAMTNDVFDPDADVYEWHPTLKAAVAAREAGNAEDNGTPPATSDEMKEAMERAVSALDHRIGQAEASIADDPGTAGTIQKLMVEAIENDRRARAVLQKALGVNPTTP